MFKESATMLFNIGGGIHLVSYLSQRHSPESVAADAHAQGVRVYPQQRFCYAKLLSVVSSLVSSGSASLLAGVGARFIKPETI